MSKDNTSSMVIPDLPVDDTQQDEINGGELKDELGKTYYIGSANRGVWK